MSDIKVVDIDLEDLIGVNEVADELDIPVEKARYAMSQQLVPCVKINGYYTLKPVLAKHLQRLRELGVIK